MTTPPVHRRRATVARAPAPILEIAAEALNVDAADLGQTMLVLPGPDGGLGKSKA